jgi:hypothetical protein
LIYTGDTKKDLSVDEFCKTKVKTCSFVVREGDDYRAIPYYLKNPVLKENGG